MFNSRISVKIFFFSLILISINIFADEPILTEKQNLRETNANSNLLLLKYDFNNFSNLSAQDTNKLKLDEDLISYKSPWLAFFFSFFLPTSGQLYNGDYTKAAIQAAVILVGGGLVVGTGCVECGDYSTLQTTLFFTGLGMAFSGYLWSIIDAPTSANENNRRMRQNTGLSLINSENGDYSIQLKRNSFSKTYAISLNIIF